MRPTLLLYLILLGSYAFGQIRTDNLEGEYRFTNSSFDDTAGENNLTQNGSSLVHSENRAGGTARAITLNGDYLTRNGMADSPMSISFWIKTTTNDANKRVIIDQTERTSDTEGFTQRGWYAYLKDGKVGVAANFLSHYWNNTAAGADKHSGYFDTEATGIVSDGTWHHVTFTASGQKISTWTGSSWTYQVRYTYGLYVDGKFEASNNVEVGVSQVGLYWRLVNPDVRLTIGNNKSGNSANVYEDEIDDIRLYNTVITLSDITVLAAETGCAGSTGVTASTQDITIQLDADGNASITPEDIDNGSVNTCGDTPTMTLDITSFTCDDLGDNTVTLSVEDEDGFTDQATAIVSVEPLITVSAQSAMTTVYLDENGMVTVNADAIDDGSTTSCGAEHITLSLDQTDFDCTQVGNNITVTLTATDDYGNSESTTALVMPEDTIAPTVVGKDISLTLDENTGTASITTVDVDNGSTDNCSVTLSLSKSSFACEDIGENEVTLTGTDNRGNSSSVVVTVTVNSIVNDETITSNTTAFCPDGNSGATISTGSSVANVTYYLRNSADNSIVDGPVAGTGSALDFSTGNISETTTYNIYAEFSNATPTNYGLDFDGVDDYLSSGIDSNFDYAAGFTYEAWVKSPLPGSTGGYLPVFFLGTSAVSDVEIYTQQTTNNLVVVFNRGKSGLGGYSFTPPPNDTWYHLAVTYDGTTVKAYYDGVEQTIVDASNPPGALTKTSGASMSVGYINASAFLNSWGSKNFLGQMDEIRVWNTVRTPTEIADNKDSCADGSETGLVAYFSLNEASGSSATNEVDNSSATLYNMDATDWIEPTITLTCEPETCGVQLSQEIKIGDSEAPSVLGTDLTIQLDQTGAASISAEQLDNGSTDNCTATEDLEFSASQTAFDCDDVGTNSITFYVTDLAGNVGEATVEITVEDNEAPTANASDLSVSLDENGQVTVDPADADNGSSDNCNLEFTLSQTSFDCSHVGENTVDFTVTDPAGNASTASITITVTDDIAPTVITKNLEMSLDENGLAVLNALDFDSASYDNCTAVGDLLFELSSDTLTCSHIGNNSIGLTVTDESGNVSSTTVFVEISDDTAPVVLAQDIVVWLDDNLTATITAEDVDAGSYDNCGLTTLTLDVSTFGEQNIGENTVQLTGIDNSNLEATANAIVMVKEKLTHQLTFDAVADKTYGDAAFAVNVNSDLGLTAQYNMVSGPATMNEGMVQITGVGEVVVEATHAGNDSVYAASTQLTIQVLPASLTVTADDISIDYGSEIPQLTYSYSGFVNGEDSEALTIAPSVSCSATSSSDAGTYDIIVTGGAADNYNMSYVNGTLTINQVSQTITLEPILDQDSTTTTVPITASSSSGLALEFSVTGPATIDGMNLILDGNLGTVTLTASQPGNVNYLPATPQTVSFEVFDPCTEFVVEVVSITEATVTSGGAIDVSVSGGNGNLDFEWSNGSTTEDISNLIPGAYTLVVTDEKGCTVTTTVSIPDIILSADKNSGFERFNVYPNPTSGMLYVQSAHGNVKGSYAVFDMSGRMVQHQKLNFATDSKIEISLEHVPYGQYMIILTTEDFTERGIILHQ